MAISIVQRAGSHSGAATTHTATFGAAATAGNLLICATRSGQSTLPVTAPTGYTEAVHEDSTSSFFGVFIWYKIAAGGETTISYTTPGNSVLHDMEIYEISGASILDATNKHDNSGSTTATTESPGSTGTLADAVEFAVAVVSTSGAHDASAAVDSGFTLRDSGSSGLFFNGMVADKITSVNTALAPTFSWTTGSRTVSAIATFRASAAAAPAIVLRYVGSRRFASLKRSVVRWGINPQPPPKYPQEIIQQARKFGLRARRGKVYDVTRGQIIITPPPFQPDFRGHRALIAYARPNKLRRFNVVPLQPIPVPEPPLIPRIKGVFPPRPKRRDYIPGQETPLPSPPRPIIPRIKGIWPRRSKRWETTPPQFNPPFPFTNLRKQRQTGILGRRSKRSDITTPQQAPPVNPPIVLRFDRRRTFNFLARRGKYREPVWPQIGVPPTPIILPFPRRLKSRVDVLYTRRGTLFKVGYAQLTPTPPGFLFTRIRRVLPFFLRRRVYTPYRVFVFTPTTVIEPIYGVLVTDGRTSGILVSDGRMTGLLINDGKTRTVLIT